MISVFNIAIGLIAIIALILSILANNKSTTNDFSDAKVMGADGQQVSLGKSLYGYLNQPEGQKMMITYLTKQIPDDQIKGVMNDGVTTTNKYKIQISANRNIGDLSGPGCSECGKFSQIAVPKTDSEGEDFDGGDFTFKKI